MIRKYMLTGLKYALSISIISVSISLQTAGQVTTEYDLLAKDFPVLSQKYIQKIKNQTASYVFVIDNSNSIAQYKFDLPIRNNIKEFLKAVPVGDRVSLIKFAERAEDIGIPATVIADNAILNSVIEEVNSQLLFTGNASDGYAATGKVLDAINKVGISDLRYVFILTDFEFYSKSNGYIAAKSNWDLLVERFAHEQKDKRVVVIALKLQMGAIKQEANYLPLLEKVFPEMKIISVNPLTLRQWFADTKAEILRDRLRFLVGKDLEPVIGSTVKARFSGNLMAEINMTESLLADSLIIENVLFEDKALSLTSLPLVIKYESGKTVSVDLGKLKHSASIYVPRFASLSGKLTFNCHLTTTGESELQKLGLGFKTFAVSSAAEGKSFLHFLPFWIDLILALFILVVIYQIIMVLKQYKFINDLDFSPQKGSSITRANFRDASSVINRSIAVIGNSVSQEGKAVAVDVKDNLGKGTKFSVKATKRLFKNKELMVKSIDGAELNDINEKWVITPGNLRYVKPGSILLINKVEVTLPRIR